MTILCLVTPGAGIEWVFIGGFWGLVAFGGLLGAYRKAVFVDASGMTIHRPIRGPIYFGWDEIAAVSYVKHKRAILIRPSWGRSQSVSIYFDGLGTLRDCLDRYAPSALDDCTRAVLPCTGLGGGSYSSNQWGHA
jgi:hypothetical protein